MSTHLSKFSYLPGSSRVPMDEGDVFPGAGVAVTEDGNGGVWIDRIVCYGKTEKEAQALRDRVLRGLELVAAQERDDEMSRRSTQRMVDSGLIVIGTANIGSQVIGAGLGSKDDD